MIAHRPREGGQPLLGFPRGYAAMDRLDLPCGRCIGCRLSHSRSWSLRVTHEAQLYDSNLFVTLDYAPEHLKSHSLEYRDFQLFMKKLRKEIRGVSRAPNGQHPIRFFCSGEYGTAYARPHFHAILFNCDFPDKKSWVNGRFQSSLAESLWGNGHVVIDAVTPRSAAYVAGYTLSKVYGSAAADHYEDVVNLQTGELSSRRPEFCTMSRRPGIGAWWYERFSGDLLPHDFAVLSGSRFPVPRYYWNRFQISGDPSVAEQIAHARFLRAAQIDPVESTPERRAAREEVAWSRLRLFHPREH